MARYRIALTVEFVSSLDETIDGPNGATREQIEDLIDENWWWLSGSTDVLLESSWKLESYEEIAADS